MLDYMLHVGVGAKFRILAFDNPTHKQHGKFYHFRISDSASL